MKILIVTDGVYPFSMGGSHRLIYETALILARIGHQVTCVIPQIDRGSYMYMQTAQWKNSENLRILRFPVNYSNLYKKVISYFSGYRESVEKLIATEVFDVVNIHYLPALFALRNFKSQPIFYTFHGPWAAESRLSYSGRVDSKNWFIRVAYRFLFEPLLYWFCVLIERYCLKKCHSFMTLSTYMCDLLSTNFGIDRQKITVIPGGVNSKNFYPEEDKQLRQRFGDDKKYIFLTVRRLEKRMGLDTLITACALLKKKTENFVLLIGGKGNYSGYLKELIKKNKCERNILMTGFIPEEDLRKYMTISDLFVLTSKDLEGFGLVVLESMACGTPILVGPNGGPQEVVREFDSRFVLNTLNSENIANCLQNFIESGILDNDVSMRSLIFSQKFTWEKFTNNYIEWIITDVSYKSKIKSFHAI